MPFSCFTYVAWRKVNLTGTLFVLFRLYSNMQSNTLQITNQLRIIVYTATEGTEFEPRLFDELS